MLKKAAFIAVSVAAANACVCEPEISTSFQSYTTIVTASLKSQKEAIKNQNIKTVEKTNELLARQNELLTKHIEASKPYALRLEQTLFELTKKNSLAK